MGFGSLEVLQAEGEPGCQVEHFFLVLLVLVGDFPNRVGIMVRGQLVLPDLAGST